MSEINELKYYYKPIESLEDLKKNLRLIKTYSPEIYENLTTMLNEIKNPSLVNQEKVYKNIDNLVNFIEKFNEQINALNLVNNTNYCNDLLDYNSKEDIKDKQKEYNKLLTKEQVAIDHINKDIKNYSMKAIKDSSFKNKNINIFNRLSEQTELLENKERVSIFDYFKKQSIFKKYKTEIKEITLIKDRLEQDIISIKRKTNNLIDFNNEKEKTSKTLLDKDTKYTLRCNYNLFKFYKTNNKELSDYYNNELYENLINTSSEYMKSKQINESIDFDKILIPENIKNYIPYLEAKIQEKNAEKLIGFIATELTSVNFEKNSNMRKLDMLIKKQCKTTFEKFTNNIGFFTGMVFSSLASISIAVSNSGVLEKQTSNELIALSSAVLLAPITISKVLKVLNKEKYSNDINPSSEKLTLENYVNSSTPEKVISVINKMFEENSYNILTKDNFEKFTNSFKKNEVKEIKFTKKNNKDIVPDF